MVIRSVRFLRLRYELDLLLQFARKQGFNTLYSSIVSERYWFLIKTYPRDQVAVIRIRYIQIIDRVLRYEMDNICVIMFQVIFLKIEQAVIQNKSPSI